MGQGPGEDGGERAGEAEREHQCSGAAGWKGKETEDPGSASEDPPSHHPGRPRQESRAHSPDLNAEVLHVCGVRREHTL